MNAEQFEKACAKTISLLKGRWPQAEPARNPGDETDVSHLLWMLVQAALFYRELRVAKANRWLGYVQGVMRALEYADVEALKRANMPEGDAFDGGRV